MRHDVALHWTLQQISLGQNIAPDPDILKIRIRIGTKNIQIRNQSWSAPLTFTMITMSSYRSLIKRDTIKWITIRFIETTPAYAVPLPEIPVTL
jgi:hypothetical protein